MANTVSAFVAPKTVEERVAQFGAEVKARLEPEFTRAGVAYPPARLVLLGVKSSKTLEVHAANAGSADGRVAPFRLIKSYPILAASGVAGPKLREGDRQVPEGIYGIERLNPNSKYHLALRVNYPNAEDIAQAATEGRTKLGGDIMIHGSSSSIGCLAMGDPVAEELFALAALTGVGNIEVILIPADFRQGETVPPSVSTPAWVAQRYEKIRRRLGELGLGR